MIYALIFIVMAGSSSATETRSEIHGDRLQIILPLSAAVCSFGRSAFKEYAVRFFVHWGIVHGVKNGLGDAEINIRPRGGDRGIPSGHTAAAFYGASYLARDCVGKSPLGQIGVFAAAMYTGGSRIEAGAHFLFQVMFGALVGIGADRLFRKRREPREERWKKWKRNWQARSDTQ